MLHEKSLKPPWQPKRPYIDPKTGKPGNVRGTYLTGVEQDDDPSPPGGDEDDESVYPEETAQALHEAYVAQETAKARYREVAKSRGVDFSKLSGQPSETKPFSEDQTRERLQAAKSRSYCAGCRRRGHWHKDPECPLNQNAGANGSSKGSPPKSAHVTDSNDGIQPSVVQVAFEVGAYEGGALLAINRHCMQ